MIHRCSYCDWVGVQPSPSEFENERDYLKALEAFEYDRDHHGCDGSPAVVSCPDAGECDYPCVQGASCPLDVEDEETIKSLICQNCCHLATGACDGVTPNLVHGDCPRDEYERTGDI